MDLHDWLLTLHLLGAFLVIAALVALWAIVLATREPNPSLPNEDAMRIGNIAGPIVGIGMMLALIFGIWLSFEVDGYHLWNPWIIAALILWAFAVWSGVQSGREFAKNDASVRTKAVRLQMMNTAAVFVILALMIWKPGA